MVVGRTSSRSFRVEKNSKGFLVLEVYIGIKAESFSVLITYLLEILAHFYWC